MNPCFECLVSGSCHYSKCSLGFYFINWEHQTLNVLLSGFFVFVKFMGSMTLLNIEFMLEMLVHVFSIPSVLLSNRARVPGLPLAIPMATSISQILLCRLIKTRYYVFPLWNVSYRLYLSFGKAKLVGALKTSHLFLVLVVKISWQPNHTSLLVLVLNQPNLT